MHLSTIRELEDAWSGSVTQLSEIEGEWKMQVPTVGDVKKWMQVHGANFGMKLTGEPVLRIAADGRGVCDTQVRWGPTQDVVTQTSKLRMTRSNVISDKPVSVRSKRVKMGFNHLLKLRTIRITYLDDELLIIRDSCGAVDALWRQGTRQAPRRAVRPPQRTEAPEPEPERVAEEKEAPAAATPRSEVDELQGRVQALKDVLEASTARAAQDREARAELAEKAAALETSLESSEVDASAIAARLKVLEGSRANAATEKALSGIRAEEETGLLLALSDKASELEERLQRTRAQGAALDMRLDSLRAQVRELGKGTWGLGKVAWARRAARGSVKREVRSREAEAREAHKARQVLERDLKRLMARIEKQEQTLESATLEEMRRARELEAEEGALQAEQLREAAERERKEALSAQLASVQSELSQLEQRSADVHNMASEVGRTMEQVAAEAREAWAAAQDLQKGGRQARRWR